MLLTDGEPTMPNLTGWSLRDVMKFAALTEFELHASGKGYAAQQSPAGTVITKKDYLVVDFESPQETLDKLKQPTNTTKENEIVD